MTSEDIITIARFMFTIGLVYLLNKHRKLLSKNISFKGKDIGKSFSLFRVIGGVLIGLLLLVGLSFAYEYITSEDDQIKSVVAVEPSPTQVVQETPVEPRVWTPQELLLVTNEIRTENNVKPLVLDELLNKSASMKLEEMTTDGVFEHISASGKNGPEYINDVGVLCYYISENLFRRYAGDSLVRNFKPSKSHWDAVNDPSYETVGFASNSKYFVMHFCDNVI